MRTQRASDVHHGYRESRGIPLARGIELADDVQIRAAYVAVDEESEVCRVDATLEVVLVDLHQIVVSLLGTLEMKN